MPEFRHDPLTKRWVIIAEDRSARPSEFDCQLPRRGLSRCPFCAGSEADTPDAIAVYPETRSVGGWMVRVIPNKYPAVQLDVAPSNEETGSAASCLSCSDECDESHDGGAADWFSPLPGIGQHEVIIESPRHIASFTDLDPELAELSLRTYQERLRVLRQNESLKYGLVFKNCRGGSGATLEHIHSQLIATGIVPSEVEHELEIAADHWRLTRRCLYCDLLEQELTRKERVVRETAEFVAYCPYAGRFPYETWILPRQHAHQFEHASSSLLGELAALMQTVLRSFEHLSADTPYNYWFHTSPFRASCHDSFHWHVVLIPRVSTQAGYEWGSGCFVNPVSPESAAHWLRFASSASRHPTF